MQRTLTAILFLASVVSVNDVYATDNDWLHWRGPTANGCAADTANPPVSWSQTQNVRWMQDLPGEGTSTPIVVGDRIFVLSAEDTNRRAAVVPPRDSRSKTIAPETLFRFMVTCVSRQTGRILWQKTAVEKLPHEGHHPTHTYAGSSPTSDGERIYVSFGSRGIYCYSLNGDLIWNKDLGDMRTRYGWGESVTPVIDGESLVINWDQEEDSYIACLDASSGNEKWKTSRPNEVTSWNTPLITEFGGRKMVVANGTHRVRAYDLADGKELWNCGGQTVNAIPSPLRVDNFVIAMSGYRGSLAAAIPLNSVGDVTQTDDIVWRRSRGTPYVPSPLLSGDRLFFTAGNRDILTVLNPRSGKVIGQPQRLSGIGSVYASPISANGHLYFLGREGTSVVLRDNDSLDVVSVNRINDATDASPVAVGSDLIIRSRKTLYCFSQ